MKELTVENALMDDNPEYEMKQVIKYNPWAFRNTQEERTIIVEGKAKKFHDLERIAEATKDWEIPPYINFISGTRGIGKTVTLMNLFMDAVSKGCTTIWTRNFEDIFRNPNFYKNFLNLGKKYCGVPEEFTARAEGVYNDVRGGDLVCLFMGINTGSKLKGNEHADCKYVLCDEFMVLPSERYPRGCGEKLGTMLGSLRGYADACVLCSNFTYITNPYWASMRIFPAKNSGVTTFEEKGTLIEVCEKGYYNMAMFPDDDPRSKALKLLQGHDQSSFTELPNFSLIEKAPYKYLNMEFMIRRTNSTIRFFSHSSGKIYVDSVAKYKKEKDVDVYTTNPLYITNEIMMVPPMLKRWLKESMDVSSIRFFEPNCLYDCLEIIYNQ